MTALPNRLAAPSFSLRQHVLMFLIGLLASAELLQAAMVSYTAAPVMGELGASPEEYSGVATLYAVIAITMIAQHRWLIERLGWRSFMQLNAAAFAIGGVVCACAGSFAGFVAGRAIMALGGAAFFTASRVLINRILAGPARFAGVQRLAIGLACGATIGPIVAAFAVAGGSWRWIYVVLIGVALAIAAISTLFFANELTAAELQTQSRPTAVIRLLLASFLLLHALQRSAFDWFGNATSVVGAALLGTALLAWFIRREAVHPTPLLHVGKMTQPRFLLGLAMFALCYLLIAATNYVLPVLLTQGLGLPLQTIGFYLGIGASGGLLAWLFLARLLPKVRAPQPFYVAAFGLLCAFALRLAFLSEEAAPVADIVPALVLFGAFVIIGLPTTALQAFRDLQADETAFSHGNQVKNMLSQFSSAAGVALATLCLQWRSSVRWSQLVESVSAANVAVDDTLAGLAREAATASGAGEGAQRAVALLGQMVGREATLMATLDFFQLLALVSGLVALAVAAWWGAGAWSDRARPADALVPLRTGAVPHPAA